MGTSKDYDGKTGGANTGFKRSATSFAKHGGQNRIQRLLARHVAVLGGSSAATSSATAGLRGAQSIAAFGAALGSGGLPQALDEVGLGDLVGGSRFDVLNGLVTKLVGNGSSLEDNAAREAAFDVLETLFPSDLQDFDELDGVAVDADAVIELLELFIASYIYRRLLPSLGQRLAGIDDASARRRRYTELRQEIRLLVRIELKRKDGLTIEWSGAEGEQIVNEVLSYAYRQMEQFPE